MVGRRHMTKPQLKKTISIGVVTVCVLASFGMWAYRSRFRPLSRAELDRAYAENHVVVTADQVYQSPAGYSILIPAGYTYTPFKTGQMSLMAFKQPSGIMVSRHWFPGDFARSVQTICDGLVRQNPTYNFGPETSLGKIAAEAVRRDFTVEKQGVQAKGVIVWFRTGRTRYQVLLNCPAQDFASFATEYETVIESLKIN
jgi:hypothetical protein